MPLQPDIQKPANDPYDLVGSNWVIESENAYRTAEESASDAATSATSQAQSAADAESKMVDEHGKTAQSVSGGYSSNAEKLRDQAVGYSTISAWMLDASGKVLGAKKHIASLVMAGTQEIRDAIDSEVSGTPVAPSSTELTDKYRTDISQVKAKLGADLDGIGHSLAGDPGAGRTPSYVSVSLGSTAEHPNPAAQVVAYNTGQSPAVEPQTLPEMPRATAPETPSTPSTPSAPHPINPTLASLISPQASTSSSTASSSTPNGSGTPSTSAGTSSASQQGHQAPEQHQQAKPPVLPGIPNIPLPNIPAAASTIVTAVTSATGPVLPTAMAPASTAPQVPASTGFTPGSSGTAPTAPVAPGLGPIGGLPTSPVVQAAPAPTGTPAAPATGAQAPSPQTPAPAPRGPVADAAWLQKTYGLAPGVEAPKPETGTGPELFITALPEPEAHLHRVLASLRQSFEQNWWGQPLAVATITRGLESCTVFATSDAISIWPAGVLLPQDVVPLDEMPGTPATSELSGSIMVADKLAALIPRGWTVEAVLSTVPGGENSQSAEQFQELVEAGELLPCTVSRGRDDVTEDEAVQAYALAVLGQATPGVSDLGSESARLRAARWVGTQPAGYLDVLSRWHLADAAESMSRGLWGDVVYAIERFQSIRGSKRQAA